MTWQNDSEYPQGVDRIGGLFIKKSGFERDNCKFYIREIANGDLAFSFDAAPLVGSFVEFDNDEKLANGGYDEALTWNVEKGVLGDVQLTIIGGALQAYSNRTGGYSRLVDGVGRRALVKVQLVDMIDRY
jgi:hypothetical protein